MNGVSELMADIEVLRDKLALEGNGPEVVRKLDAILKARNENMLSVNDIEKAKNILKAHQ